MGDERYVDEELSKAREALPDADRLASSGGTSNGIVNRLYYAAFHAAQAALYDRGIKPSTHGGVLNRFGEEIVLGGATTREQGRLRTTLADLRQQADYGYEQLDADVESLRDRTRTFIQAMTDLTGAPAGSDES